LGVLGSPFPLGIPPWLCVPVCLGVSYLVYSVVCLWSVVRGCWLVAVLWAWTGVVWGSACAFLTGESALAWSCCAGPAICGLFCLSTKLAGVCAG